MFFYSTANHVVEYVSRLKYLVTSACYTLGQLIFITLYSEDASWDNFIEFRYWEYVSAFHKDASQVRGAIYNEMFMASGNGPSTKTWPLPMTIYQQLGMVGIWMNSEQKADGISRLKKLEEEDT